jgi:AcrR family transcriptional regulator
VAGTKERILEASSGLFARQGYSGTGMNQIVAEAEAALGSIYHFFPGGKEELGREAILRSGAFYGELIDAAFAGAQDVARAVDEFFRGAAQHLADTGYADACPIATVALEVASTNDALREATAIVFEDWITKAAEALHAAGITHAQARHLATLMFCLLEGAFLLCRATRSTAPLDIARAHAADAVAGALSGGGDAGAPGSAAG